AGARLADRGWRAGTAAWQAATRHPGASQGGGVPGLPAPLLRRRRQDPPLQPVGRLGVLPRSEQQREDETAQKTADVGEEGDPTLLYPDRQVGLDCLEIGRASCRERV